MTGIDKIIKQIESDTKIQCDDIISTAEKNAERTINEANLDIVKRVTKIENDADRKYKDIIKRGESSADLEERKTILLTKQEVISDMIKNSKQYLENLPDDEYFDLMLKLVEKNHTSEKGEIKFNKKDLSRIKDDFQSKLDVASKNTLTLSKDSIDINSGFVLFYDGIEENCTFDALFSSLYEKMTDKVTKLLF